MRYYCHAFYQAKGAYAQLHQQSDKYLEYSFSADTAKVFYDDPFNLSIPYTFLLERLPAPPDGALKSMFSLTLILFLYFYPVVRGLILHWSRSTFASNLAKYNRNVFVPHGIHRLVKCIPVPTMYVKAFSTSDDHSKYSFSWDTYGIPLVIDNSVTAIIRNQSILFTCPLIPTLLTLEISERLTTTTEIVGGMKLILTDDANKHHLYIIPPCVFDPNIPVNILGVPALGTLFGDNADATDPPAEDGTTIK